MIKELEKVNTILFDFDGTLINTNNVIIESFQHIYEKYHGKRVDVSVITKAFGEPLLITIPRDFPGCDVDEVINEYRTYQKEHAENLVEEFVGVYHMLIKLQRLNYNMCIVTSRTRESTLNYLNMFDMASFFNEIVSCEDTNVHKPNPEPIYIALNKMNVSKEEAIMVGDGPFDIKCANNAGVKSCLVGWKITEDKNPLIGDYKEDYFIKTPADLVDLLSR